MPDRLLYEYAVIRLVPRVEREEFLNVGVILYCAGRGFLACRTEINPDRLKAFSPAMDWSEAEQYLTAFKLICHGDKEGGALAALPASSRFRWLTATRSTVIQASKVHPGFCSDPEETLMRLFAQQVK